ncbi:MAG: hypothetical protein ACI82A_003133 [Candidatus Azotimanducaceae bacterium]|jgi:hypothetical protein
MYIPKKPVKQVKYWAILSMAVSAQAALASELSFTAVQAEEFGVAGSLSNAWADFDNDGDMDFAVSIKGGEVRLYRNDAGKFVSVGQTMGLPTQGDEIRGISWGDYDGDGDVDLLGGSNVSPIPSRSYVFRNDEAKKFVEVATEIGLSTEGRWARQSNWVDFDNDGDLDLYAANRTGANRLYVNSNGVFKAMSYQQGASDPRRTVGACWFDMDNDGDLDIFLANQSGDSDAMWRNDITGFVDVAPALGIDETLRDLSSGGVGCAVGDYDNDGDFDLYVGTYAHNLLYKNDGNGDFTEVAEEMGVIDPDHTVGAAWGDYNNDGLLDLMVIGYYRNAEGQVPSDRLYLNTGNGFTNVLEAGSLLDAGDHGVTWVDYDNDGDLDLSITDGYGPVGGHHLFRNELTLKERMRQLQVLVLDSEGHFTQAGAEVRLYNKQGELVASRIVSTGGGYNSQDAIPVYFAIQDKGPVSVEVRFMGPNGGTLQRIDSIRLKDYRGKKLTILKESNDLTTVQK